MTPRKWMALALLTAFAHNAHAADTGFYVTAGGGKSWQRVDHSQGILIEIDGGAGIVRAPPRSTDVDEGNFAWNAALGYQINRYFAAEVSYLHYGSTQVTETYSVPAGVFTPPHTFDLHYALQVEGPALSILGRLPFGQRFAVFARGGVFFAAEKFTEEGAPAITFGQKVWLAGAGLEWSLARPWALRLEYAESGHVDSNPFVGRSAVRHLALDALYSW